MAKQTEPSYLAELPTVSPDPVLPPKPSEQAGALAPALHTADLTTQAGRYRLEGELGRGGMGTVFRAYDPDIGRSLAVKVLQDRHYGRADLERRFLSEAQLTGQLQHPGVPPVHEIGRLSDGRPFFAMKLVKGRTLTELLKDRPNSGVELPRFLGIFTQVCQTVAYAHSQGVIHRDLKPANIMVGAFGEVQVMDWGLAKVVKQGTVEQASQLSTPERVVQPEPAAMPDDLSQIGSVLGTAGYMAPEQARGETRTLDERCDVFGLGALLCEILTGKPPFCRGNGPDLVIQAADGDLAEAFARLHECGADAELVEVARACLAVKPEERPRDGEAVAKAIADYQAGVAARLHKAELELAEAEVRAGEEWKRRQLVVANDRLKVLGKVKGPAIGLVIVGVLGLIYTLMMLVILVFGMVGAFEEGNVFADQEVQRRADQEVQRS
jgi:serine/threonine-protein kinase